MRIISAQHEVYASASWSIIGKVLRVQFHVIDEATMSILRISRTWKIKLVRLKLESCCLLPIGILKTLEGRAC